MAITPYLLYEDVGGALKFLAKAFGFRKYGSQLLVPNGKISHAAMQLGDDLIMMGCPASGYRNPKRLGQATQHLYVNVEDVDKHFERAKKAGARILEGDDGVTSFDCLKKPSVNSGTSTRSGRLQPLPARSEHDRNGNR